MNIGRNFEQFATAALVECSARVAVEAFNAGFSDYLVPITMTVEKFEGRFRAEDLDPFASRLWFSDGKPAAFLLIGRRGRMSRINALGVSPRFRGLGVGHSICKYAVDEASQRADTHLWLEVIEANERGRALYRNAGFQEQALLLGFTLPATQPLIHTAEAIEVPIERGIAIVFSIGVPEDLPWQLQPATLAAAIAPVRCFIDRRGEIAAFVDDGSSGVRLVGLFVSDRAERAETFMSSLCALYQDRPWVAPPIFPAGYGDRFFEPSGWAKSDMRQIRMVHRLHQSDHRFAA